MPYLQITYKSPNIPINLYCQLYSLLNQYYNQLILGRRVERAFLTNWHFDFHTFSILPHAQQWEKCEVCAEVFENKGLIVPLSKAQQVITHKNIT